MYLPEWAQKFKEPKTEIRIIGGHCYNVPRVCAVRDCGAVACPPTRKFERATMLEYPLKPLWHIHFVVRSCFCFNPIVM
jgi:hypothetical protein